MPIAREPSQRGLNWVRWNSSKTSLISAKSSAPTEIIHLGGSRVGTPTDPESPTLGKPEDRPCTQWTFYPPPPHPPGQGITRSQTEPGPVPTRSSDDEAVSSIYEDEDDDRPVTQWFMTGWRAHKTSSGDPSNRNLDEVLITASPGLSPPPLTIPTTRGMNQHYLPSPISPASKISSAMPSPLTTVTTPCSDAPSTRLQSPATTSSLPFSPKSSLPHGPFFTSTETLASSQAAQPARGLRRTQSHAELSTARKQAQWKALPPRPIEDETSEDDVVSPKQHIGRLMMRSNTKPSPLTPKSSNGLKIFPPIASAPPSGPLPAITSAQKADVQAKRRDRSTSGTRSRSKDGRDRRSPPRSRQGSPSQQQQQQAQAQAQGGNRVRHTAQERLWLHRNYRGEATFLKAWGLQLTKDEDRAEGIRILRELMAGEAEAEREEERRQQEQQQHRMRSRSLSRLESRGTAAAAATDGNGVTTATTSSTSTTTSGAQQQQQSEGGLHVIMEEDRNSREFRLHHPRKESLGYAAGGSSDEVWREASGREGGGSHHQRLMIPIGRFTKKIERHGRSESESSVLGAYLDIRMSRLD
ncbi:hypothetical protein F4778DRAFT_737665 [Xylariomycetidae sp. FL2044]|nr:hypothetical protein F4778DRAFT_737665 [Xylariomycetidae sp. FL2044]